MKTLLSPFACLLFVVVIASACHKTDHSTPAPTQPGRFEVLLQPYMADAAMDSAIVNVVSNGVTTAVRLTQSGDTLYCALNEIPAGDVQVTVTLYPTKPGAWRRLLWTTGMMTVTNDGKTMMSYKGPTDLLDVKWLPRLFIPDPILKLTFVCGLRPEDPYFSLENVNPKYVDIEVYKEFFKTKKGIANVASKSFACKYDCPLVHKKMENTIAFAGIPQQIGNRIWDHIEISVSFGDGDYRNGWSVLTYNVTLPD